MLAPKQDRGVERSDDAVFVATVEQALAAAERDQASAARGFIEVGRMLLARKEAGKRDGSIPHGQWVNWLERNFPPRSGRDRVRRLQHYMQAAEAIDTADEAAKTKLTSFLPEGLNAVLDEIRNLKRRSRPKIAPLSGDVRGEQLRILVGDCRERLKELPDESVHCCITSPPYFGLRNYEIDGQIGLETTPQEFGEHLCLVFDEVWRVLRDDGTLWIVIGDSFNSGPPGANPGGFQGAAMRANPAYNSAQSRKPVKGGHKNGLKPKDLIGIPWMVAFALRARGWHLRSEVIWQKRNTTPESVTDRPTKSHETVFLLTKRPTYYYDAEAIREPAVSVGDPRKGTRHEYNGKYGKAAFAVISEDDKRNARDVWTIASEPFVGDHFAPFPKALVKPMVLAGTSEVGCCSKCGAPWARTFERIATKEYRYQKIGIPGEGEQRGRRDGQCGSSQYAPSGWSLSCACNASIVPCTVLDIFGGTGTTALVANALGRKAVLIEASPQYAAMAQERIEKELPEYTAKANSEDAWGNRISRDDDEQEAA